MFQDRRPVIIYYHGHANCRACDYRIGLYRALSQSEKLDAHVFAIDYRGFGDSTKVRVQLNSLLQELKQIYTTQTSMISGWSCEERCYCSNYFMPYMFNMYNIHKKNNAHFPNLASSRSWGSTAWRDCGFWLRPKTVKKWRVAYSYLGAFSRYSCSHATCRGFHRIKTKSNGSYTGSSVQLACRGFFRVAVGKALQVLPW